MCLNRVNVYFIDLLLTHSSIFARRIGTDEEIQTGLLLYKKTSNQLQIQAEQPLIVCSRVYLLASWCLEIPVAMKHHCQNVLLVVTWIAIGPRVLERGNSVAHSSGRESGVSG
jgi:hypothetical protein